MASMPLALSVHNFISSVGADAGFAAIIGLAILVLLYFAHARETANLREQAALLTQRLQQAEARVAQLSRAQAAAPQAATPAPAPAAALAYPALVPAAPAGMAAPALAAATRVVPLVAPQAVAPEAAPAPAAVAAAPAADTVAAPEAEPAAEPAAEPVAVGAAAAAESFGPPPPPAQIDSSGLASEPPPPAADAQEPAETPPVEAAPAGPEQPEPDAEPAAPAALTAAGANTAVGANGAGHDNGPVAAAGQPAPVGPPPVTTARPGPRVAAAQSSVRRTLPPLSPPPQRRSRFGQGFLLLAGMLVIVGGLAALVLVTAGSDNGQRSSTGTATSNAPGSTRAKSGFDAAKVTVSVLNGTATNELAHTIAARLARAGYKEGTIATAANQTETTTKVAYLPGSTNRADALHVASALKLSRSSVEPIDQSTQQVACPSSAACTANVVVTVGADLANS